MKIITKYIFKESLLYTLIALIIFTTLLLVGRLVQLTDLIISKGVELSQISLAFVSLIPTFLEISLPISVLLGVCTCISRMSGDSEIVVLRACGFNLKKFLPAIFLLATLIFLLHLLVSFYFRPWGYKNLSNTLFNIAKTKSTSGLSSGVFNKLGNIIIYPENLDSSSGAMQGVLIDDQRIKNNRKIITAATGLITSNSEEQSIQIRLFDGSSHEQSLQNQTITNFKETEISVNISEIFPTNSNAQNKVGRDLDIVSLAKLIKASTKNSNVNLKNSFNERSLSFEFYSRFTLPTASFIFAILALSLGIIPPRVQKTWGQTLVALLGLITFILYFALHTFAATINESNVMPTIFCAILPSLAFITITIFIFGKMSSEQWSSVTAGFENLVLKIKMAFKK